ncbi:MAG TPA: DUF2339 domain-containing protein [Dongiaceae bacterium]|nr:DUF2339 domain-containing protein [Dongiaceae bacterium]
MLFDDGDMVFFLFGVLIGLFFLVGVPVMAVVAYRRSGEHLARLAEMQKRVVALEGQLQALLQGRTSAAPQEVSSSVVPASSVASAVPASNDVSLESQPPLRDAITPQPALPAETPAAATVATPDAAPETAPSATTPPDMTAAEVAPLAPMVAESQRAPRSEPLSLELLFGARGFVWIGGLSIALAGAFFVKYSLDQGLLSPVLRIGLALLFGIVLLVAGEWMRGRSSSIAQSLIAAGFADLFASLFAAHAIYDLIPAALDFILLGAVTAGGIFAALRHGPFVGLVGMAGGFLTPALVSSNGPHPTALFVFLFLILAGAMLLWRRRRWWYVAALGLVGSLAWAWLTVQLNWIESDNSRLGEIQLPIFILAISALLVWTFDGRLALWGRSGPGAAPLTQIERLIDMAGNLVAALLLAVWLANGGYSLLDWTFLIALMILHLLAARYYANRELIGFGTAALVLATLAAMPLQTQLFAGAASVDRSGDIIGLTVALGVLLIVGGYGISFGAIRPVRWSGLSVLASAALFAISYIDFRHRDLLLSWPLWSILLAGLHLVFAERLFNRRGSDLPYRASFAVHCLAVIGFIAAAIPLQVGSGWIAVIWALMLPPVIWIGDRLQEIWLRRVVWVATPGILIALLLSGFPVSDRPILNWLLYGVGVPFLCFVASGWLLRQPAGQSPSALRVARLPAGEDRGLRLLVDLTASFLGFLLISLEVRQFFHGTHLVSADFSLTEAATLAILWLAAAHVIARIALQRDEAKLIWAALLLALLGGAAMLFGPLLFLNPLFSAIDIGATPILNRALYAYLIPAAGCLVLVRSFDRARIGIGGDSDLATGIAVLKSGLGVVGIVTGFVGISILDRQLFAGSIVAWPSGTFIADLKSDAELYGYSLAWLGYGAALILLAILTDSRPLRHAAAGIILLAILKVFLIDAAGLTGLYRVASFLGLGLCLIALGYLYQRFVLVRHA